MSPRLIGDLIRTYVTVEDGFQFEVVRWACSEGTLNKFNARIALSRRLGHNVATRSERLEAIIYLHQLLKAIWDNRAYDGCHYESPLYVVFEAATPKELDTIAQDNDVTWRG